MFILKFDSNDDDHHDFLLDINWSGLVEPRPPVAPPTFFFFESTTPPPIIDALGDGGHFPSISSGYSYSNPYKPMLLLFCYVYIDGGGGNTSW